MYLHCFYLFIYCEKTCLSSLQNSDSYNRHCTRDRVNLICHYMCHIFSCYQMDRVKRIWYLSHMRAAKVQASLVSPEPSLLAHTSSESSGTFRQKARSLAPLNGWASAVKICHNGMLEDTNSLDGAQIVEGKDYNRQTFRNIILLLSELRTRYSHCRVTVRHTKYPDSWCGRRTHHCYRLHPFLQVLCQEKTWSSKVSFFRL